MSIHWISLGFTISEPGQVTEREQVCWEVFGKLSVTEEKAL